MSLGGSGVVMSLGVAGGGGVGLRVGVWFEGVSMRVRVEGSLSWPRMGEEVEAVVTMKSDVYAGEPETSESCDICIFT